MHSDTQKYKTAFLDLGKELSQVWWLVHPTVKWHTRNELKFIWIVIFNSWDGYFHTCVYHRSIFLFKIEYMFMLWTFCINTVIDRCTCLINAWPAKSPLPQCFLHIYDCLAQLYVSSYATDFDGRVSLQLTFESVFTWFKSLLEVFQIYD